MLTDNNVFFKVSLSSVALDQTIDLQHCKVYNGVLLHSITLIFSWARDIKVSLMDKLVFSDSVKLFARIQAEAQRYQAYIISNPLPGR